MFDCVCMGGTGGRIVGSLGKLAPVFSRVIKTESFLLAIHWNSAETNGNLKIRIPRGENVQLLGIARESDQ